MESKGQLENPELSWDWQVNLVEGEKNLYKSTNKYENVEINFQLKNLKTKTEGSETLALENKMLRLNYYEFSEMYENFKKLDQQLHMFKN